jgi:competence protein ComEA
MFFYEYLIITICLFCTTPMKPEQTENRYPILILRHRDQLVVGVLVVCCVMLLLLHWCWQGGHLGKLIEVERMVPGTVPYVVDVNQAEWIEFTVLPGVGETLAKRIVEYRVQQGPYRDLDDLARVKGIGPRTVERLRPYLRPIADRENTAERSSR